MLLKLKVWLSTDAYLSKLYYKYGCTIGNMVSYEYFGKCSNYDKMLEKFTIIENEYLKRGYKTISKFEWVEAGGYGVDCKHLLLKT